jgi:hypothetical protein
MIKNKLQNKTKQKKKPLTTSIKSFQYIISHHKLIGRKNEKGELKALKQTRYLKGKQETNFAKKTKNFISIVMLHTSSIQ